MTMWAQLRARLARLWPSPTHADTSGVSNASDAAQRQQREQGIRAGLHDAASRAHWLEIEAELRARRLPPKDAGS